MELEELLGAELYRQVAAKIDEKNAGEPDKLKHVRYAELSEGKYVGKGMELQAFWIKNTVVCLFAVILKG